MIAYAMCHTPEGRRLNALYDSRNKFAYSILAAEGKWHRSRPYRHFITVLRCNSRDEIIAKLAELKAVPIDGNSLDDLPAETTETS